MLYQFQYSSICDSNYWKFHQAFNLEGFLNGTISYQLKKKHTINKLNLLLKNHIRFKLFLFIQSRYHVIFKDKISNSNLIHNKIMLL